MENGEPLKIPINFDYNAGIEEVKSALAAVGTDEDGMKIPLFENITVPDTMRNELANAGQSAASSWQSAMLSSISSVAASFQTAMGKGLQLDNTLLQSQIGSLKNHLSMAFSTLPTDENSKNAIRYDAMANFTKAYDKVKKDIA